MQQNSINLALMSKYPWCVCFNPTPFPTSTNSINDSLIIRNTWHMCLISYLYLISNTLMELIKINIILISSDLWNYLSIILMKRWIVFSVSKSSHYVSCSALLFLDKSFTLYCLPKSMVICDLSKFECSLQEMFSRHGQAECLKKINFDNYLQRHVYAFVCIFARG